MSKITRRSAVVMSLMAPTTGMAFPLGGEIDSSMVGINIRLAWIHKGWHVWLPDYNAMEPSGYWRPGMAVVGKWHPLREYLAEIEDTYHLKPLT